MIVEDLAAIDEVNEEKIMSVLQERFKRGLYYTYIGDILIFVNPNTPLQIYGHKVTNYIIFWQHYLRFRCHTYFLRNSSITANINGNLDRIIHLTSMPSRM